jgi:Putative methyltransferase
MSDEWVEWHRGYEPGQPRLQRLEVVQARIREALDRRPPGPIRVLSLCAGDGRDILGVLASHPRAHDVRARLVEISPELLEAGREKAVRGGLTGVEWILGDASTTSAFAGAVPANLVLVCGVFGNIVDEDIRNTIHHLPELCARDATVIWTRGRFEPDLTPTIRHWFSEAGFAELSFVAIPGTTMSVGAHRLVGEGQTFHSDMKLFTFLPYSERPSTRAKNRTGGSTDTSRG